jgi:glyoxylase-like metal-dependent hydrolase (beta-lactamase superfamily II)
MVRKVFDGRVAFHDGADEIAPGITVHKSGGHSKGLQSIRVKTRRGYVMLASDATHLYAHIEDGRVFPTTYNIGEVAGMPILKLADFLIRDVDEVEAKVAELAANQSAGQQTPPTV